MTTNILDQIFDTIDHKGKLRSRLPDVNKLHPMARSIIERILQRGGRDSHFNLKDLYLLASEIETAKDETLETICGTPLDNTSIIGLHGFLNRYMSGGISIFPPFLFECDSAHNYLVENGRTDLADWRYLYRVGKVRDAIDNFDKIYSVQQLNVFVYIIPSDLPFIKHHIEYHGEKDFKLVMWGGVCKGILAKNSGKVITMEGDFYHNYALFMDKLEAENSKCDYK